MGGDSIQYSFHSLGATLGDLAARELAGESRLGRLVEQDSRAARDVSAELASLEDVLDSDQMLWLRNLLDDKTDLKEKLETISATADGVLAALGGVLESAGNEAGGPPAQERLA